MKSNKGIGMIKLILMILFIVAIVATSVYYIRIKYNEIIIETIKTDMLQVEWKIKDYIDKQTVKGEEKQYLGTKLTEVEEDLVLQDFLNKNVLEESEYEKYYLLKDEDLEAVGLEIINYEGSYFLINYETYEVIVTKGCIYSEDKILYKLTDITDNAEVEENQQDNQE